MARPRFSMRRLVAIALLLVAAACSPDSASTLSPAMAEDPDDHRYLRSLAVFRVVVLMNTTRSAPADRASAPSDVIDIAAHVVREGDTRRPEVDLCCNVVARAERSPPAEHGPYLGFLGKLTTEEDEDTIIGYYLSEWRQLYRPDYVGGGPDLVFDGFSTIDEMFAEVNSVPPLRLMRTTPEALAYVEEVEPSDGEP